MTLDGVTKDFGAGGQKPSVGDFTAGPGMSIATDLLTNKVELAVDSSVAFKSDLSAYASVSYVDSSINALSSVYAPLSDYASQAWESANFLSSG